MISPEGFETLDRATSIDENRGCPLSPSTISVFFPVALFSKTKYMNVKYEATK
jgi:hypothetical protein